jgi:DNA-binding LacI/PurR family transcriptional regulator/anti-anti-sigma regulatory factor
MDKALSNHNGRHTKPQNTRPTIGLLTYGMGMPLNDTVWWGVADAAQERDVNLLCLPGKPLRSPIGFDAQANVLYDLVSAENIDGLVIWGGALAHHVSSKEIQVFCERYRPLPIVSISLLLEGIPSLLVDDYQGMHHAIVHLIEIHGYRRIVFVRGPEGLPEAEARYRGYVDALTEHDIALDPTLIVPGEFTKDSGAAAIPLLLDERTCDFDAVATAADPIAIGAIEALQARGIYVPGDVAVVGFDDAKEAEFITPPLTTVRQPMYELARRATEMLFALMRGESVPERVIFPVELVVRQSCGCWTSTVTLAAAGSVAGEDKPFDVAFTARREAILSAMARAMGTHFDSAALDKVEQFLDAFIAELENGSSVAFLSALDELLHQEVAAGGDVEAWQGMLSVLRRHTLPCLIGDSERLSRAEDLWQQARVMIGETAQQARVYQALQAEREAEELQQVGQALITTFDVTELTDIMAKELPQLGIPSCYLSLYEGQEVLAKESSLILAYDENGRIKLGADEQRFPSRQLAPDGLLHRERHYTMIVEPLYFRQDQIGFALFEVGPRSGILYETLRAQLSSAMKGALLFQERKQAEAALQRAYGEVEKQVEERTAELKQEIAERQRAQAESQRAQEESQRLQQEVIEAQRRAIQELSTPVIPVMDAPGGAGGIIVMPLIGSIDTLRARDIMRTLLAGIREHRAKVVILDITGVLIVDSGVANHLNKTIQAARLKGARTIVTGISDAVAETIVDLGIDWSGIETLSDLQTGLRTALSVIGLRIVE